MKSMSGISKTGGSVLRNVGILVLSVATLAVTTTGALFTETDSVGSNQFSTGSVDLTTTPTSAAFSATGMAPGDSTVGKISVQNSGSLEFRYALESTTDEDTLAAQLDLTVWDESEETTVDGTCASTAPATVLYGAADLGATTTVSVFGDSTQGSQTGDRVLGAGGSEDLCFEVALPSSTGNTYEDLTTTATLDFVSEQTANNA